MQIGIIGAGHIGATVGKLWAKVGHTIRFGTRHPNELDALVTSIGSRASAGTAREALEAADVVLLAVPLAATPELGASLADLWKGKIVLDATNPYPDRDGDAAREAVKGRGSSAWTQSKLPGARVVKAFNMQRYTALQAEAHEDGDPLAVALASDDAEALHVAEKLVRDAGFEPVVIGGLEKGRAVEPGTPHYANGAHAAELRRDMPTAAQPRA